MEDTVKLYSDFARRRALQIAGDLLAVVVLVAGIALSVSIYNAIADLSAVGADVEQSGSDFATNMAEIGDSLSQVPLIGGGISTPFDAAGSAGETLAAAGESLQRTIEGLASLTGWSIALVVVAVVVLGWMLPRAIGAVRRTTNARLAASPSSWDLLAFRALAERPIRDVAHVGDDVVGAWRRRDPAVIRRLAALQLKASGVRLSDDGSGRP